MIIKLKTSPKSQAKKDIAEWLKVENILIADKNHDVWTVTVSRLDTTEQRKLNYELGLHSINKTKKNG